MKLKNRKKRSGFLGLLGAGALAAIAAMPSNTTLVVAGDSAPVVITKQKQDKEQAPVQAPTNSRINDQLPSMIGGMALGGKNAFFGIPPHIYGMYHVRKGTHKRSNKSKRQC